MCTSELLRSEARSRFELLLDGQVTAFIDYVDHGNVLELTHTVTKPDFRGRGFARELVNFALTHVTAEKKQVMPSCPYVAEHIARHPEFAHLVARTPRS